jgi:hypothetical protein|tara:strand:- start:124 stop:657 length:534 start_codon:yes stop_codon:yes gene_type:complete
MITKTLKNLLFYSIFLVFLSSCGKDFFKYSPAKENPVKGKERAKKNVAEGRGVNLGGLTGRGKTTYEFSTSNPLWRASLDILDFIPMSTVDYSGGTIISDWYSDGSRNDESVKITVRFLSNEIRSESLKVVIHQKKCSTNQACKINLVSNSILIDELQSSILRKAAQIDAEQRKKKK